MKRLLKFALILLGLAATGLVSSVEIQIAQHANSILQLQGLLASVPYFAAALLLISLYLFLIWMILSILLEDW